MTDSANRQALLGSLKIDREANAEDQGRPIKWFVLIAVIIGAAFVWWFVDLPGGGASFPVQTALARTVAAAPAGTSVLDATGYVVARRQATVSAKTTGKVVAVLIEEGVAVTENQLLARLDDSIPQAQLQLAKSQLNAARAGLEEIKVQLRQAQLDLDRSKGLAQRNLASQADLDRDQLSVEALVARLDRADQEVVVAQSRMAVQQQQVDDMQIRAPFAGVVIAKAAQPGEMISPISAGGGFTRTGICTIVDMNSLEVEVDVNESYINRVYPQQPVKISLNAYPDEAYPAEVIAIIPAADRNKATVRVRVAFRRRDKRVLPDMGVRVAFLGDQLQQPAESGALRVIVPQSAIASDTQGDFVYVIEDERVARRAVSTGIREGSGVRIVAGLEGGEKIVAKLPDALKLSLADGDRVSLVN